MANSSLQLKEGKRYYPNVCGVKSGYTQESGASLVAAAKESGRYLLLALGDSPHRATVFADAKKLLEVALREKPMEKEYFPAQAILSCQHSLLGASQPLRAKVKERVARFFYPSQEGPIEGRIVWEALVPPVKKGQYVGRLEIVNAEKKILAQSLLLAVEDVEPDFHFRLQNWIYAHKIASFLALFFLFFTILFFLTAH